MLFNKSDFHICAVSGGGTQIMPFRSEDRVAIKLVREEKEWGAKRIL